MAFDSSVYDAMNRRLEEIGAVKDMSSSGTIPLIVDSVRTAGIAVKDEIGVEYYHWHETEMLSRFRERRITSGVYREFDRYM